YSWTFMASIRLGRSNGAARGNHLDLDPGAHRQRRNGDRRARGIGLADITFVDLVDGGEVAHAGEEDRGLDHVPEGQASGGEDGLQVFERLPDLGGDVASDQ